MKMSMLISVGSINQVVKKQNEIGLA